MKKFKTYKTKRALVLKQKATELKVYRRRRILRLKRKGKVHRTDASFTHKLRLRSLYSLLLRNFRDKGYISKQHICGYIKAPNSFSFKLNFDDSILFFKQIISTFILSNKSIIIDFSKCSKVNVSNFIFFDILIKDLLKLQNRYNTYSYKKVYRDKVIDIRPSNNEKVQKYLHILGYINSPSLCDGNKGTYLLLGLQKGKGKNYHENRKAKVCSKIVAFVNNSFRGSNSELRAPGVNAIDNLVSEVLSNAEDHSLKNSEWYVNGITFKEMQHNVDIVELNLSILNIGYSMYEGFEQTKVANKENYKKVEEVYDAQKKLFTSSNKFEKESLYTLHMLQEGISRLKYEKESRGNGTMNFIEAFIVLGSFGAHNQNFKPELNIVSGHTVLICDNKYQPFEENGLKKLSLNKEKSLFLLPDREYIKYNKEYFPGTFLECKIYLNKDFFNEILED